MSAAHLLIALGLSLPQAPPPAVVPPAVLAVHPFFLAGAQYGTPLRTAASVALFLPDKNPATHPILEGWLLEAGAGQGGARVSVGRARFLEYLGIDLRGVVTRTFRSPRGATARSSYGGVEAGLTIAYVKLSAGVAHRLGGSGDKSTIFTWSGAIQIPIK